MPDEQANREPPPLQWIEDDDVIDDILSDILAALPPPDTAEGKPA